MKGMSPEEVRRAVAMWGLAMCLLAASAGWVFMRFGQAWSIADLPVSDYVSQIVPAYVITEVAMIPVGGKLVDKYGCRAVLGFAPFLYIFGSLLCVVSISVEMLVAFRLLQGAGAGLILALAFTAVGKYYEGAKRGKCSELMTAAFAIGSLFGTAFGYFLTDTFNWRTGFIVFAALTMVGTVLAWRFLPEEDRVSVPIDRVGLISASVLFGLATLYTQVVNVNFDLISVPSGLIAAALFFLTVLLIYHSRRMEWPPIPVHLPKFERNLIILMFMFSLCGLGLIQYFFKLYLTFYEFNIYRASMMFLVMIGGAAITSMTGSRLVYKTGARPWIILGSVITACGLALTHFIADKGVLQLGISLFVFGIGLGCIVTQIICSMQSVVPRREMGLHIGNLMAVRMVAIMAGNAIIGTYISNVIDRNHVSEAINLSAADNIVSAIMEYVMSGVKYVADSLASGFLAISAILAVVAALLTLLALTLSREDVEALGREEE